jgi:hypothetical protein
MKIITDKDFFEAVEHSTVTPLSHGEIVRCYDYLMQDVRETLGAKYPATQHAAKKDGSIVLKLLKPLKSLTATVSEDIRMLTDTCGTLQPAMRCRGTSLSDNQPNTEPAPIAAMAFERKSKNGSCRIMAEYENESLSIVLQLTGLNGMPLTPFWVTAVDENNTALINNQRYGEGLLEIRGVEPGKYVFTLRSGDTEGDVTLEVQ